MVAAGGEAGGRGKKKKKKISPRRRKVSRNFMAQFVERFSPRGGGRVAEGKRVSQKSAICEIQKRERERNVCCEPYWQPVCDVGNYAGTPTTF